MKQKISPSLGRVTLRRAAICLALPLILAAAPVSAEEDEAGGGIVIKDFVLTHAIGEREPIDMVEDFTLADDKGYAFFRIYNDGPPERVTAVWLYEGQVHANVHLSVGTSQGWRTWSSTNLKPGQWRVLLRDSNGTVLAERNFAVASQFAQDEDTQDMTPAGSHFDDGMSQQAEDWPELKGSVYPRFDHYDTEG